MIWGIPILNVAVGFQLVNTMATLIIGGVMYLFRAKFVARDDFVAMSARVLELETEKKIAVATAGAIADASHSKDVATSLQLERLAIEAGQRVFDAHLQTLATKDDVSEINVTLAEQNGQRSALAQKVNGIDDQLKQLTVLVGTMNKHLLSREQK